MKVTEKKDVYSFGVGRWGLPAGAHRPGVGEGGRNPVLAVNRFSAERGRRRVGAAGGLPPSSLLRGGLPGEGGHDQCRSPCLHRRGPAGGAHDGTVKMSPTPAPGACSPRGRRFGARAFARSKNLGILE